MPEKYFSSLIEANQNVGLDVLTLSKFEFEVELLAFRYWSSKFEVKVDVVRNDEEDGLRRRWGYCRWCSGVARAEAYYNDRLCCLVLAATPTVVTSVSDVSHCHGACGGGTCC
ncbi:hypothetical protein DEO72_LG9g533 [Vigna unguiculata]|uniref:Uncharacterized protein n=1 Tax=Vigna unguiculata TaxID=3917 RepID=A0A4D6MVL4_VIGUN|nr:hypothetical protein DEO72_LG9g533 [Vigna unguiculata]